MSSNACVECIQERNERFKEQSGDRAEESHKKKVAAYDAIDYVKGIIEYMKEVEDPEGPESTKLLELELSILPKTRKAAEYLGEKFYYTGGACRERGHYSKRKTSTGVCAECIKEYSLWYRKLYKEEYRASANNRRARIKEVGGTFTAKDIDKLFLSQDGLCTACDENLSISGYEIDHIYPISKGGSNWPENLQLLCPPCNREKSAKLPEEWEKIVKRKRKKRNPDK